MYRLVVINGTVFENMAIACVANQLYLNSFLCMERMCLHLHLHVCQYMKYLMYNQL